jgi:hypothetical protein
VQKAMQALRQIKVGELCYGEKTVLVPTRLTPEHRGSTAFLLILVYFYAIMYFFGCFVVRKKFYFMLDNLEKVYIM